MKNYIKASNIVAALMALPALHAQAFSIDRHLISGGGGTSADAIYQVSGDIGQPDADVAMTGDGYSVTGGYWSEELDHPVASPMTAHRTAGLALLVALADMATYWSGSSPVTLTGINLVTTNGVTVQTNSQWILYPKGSPNVNDQISYTISDEQGGTDTGWINVVVDLSVTGTNSISQIVVGSGSNTLNAYGIPGYRYITERTTSLAPALWVAITTNTATANGVLSVPDPFTDLNGIPPTSAFYRLKWEP